MCAYYPNGPYMPYPPYYYPYQPPTQKLTKPKTLTNMTATSQVTKQLKDLPQYLDQLQHVLKTTQSFVPYIKQYGPLLKSLPELIQVFKSDDKPAEKASKLPAKTKETDRPKQMNFLSEPLPDTNHSDESEQLEPLISTDYKRPSCLTIEAFEEIVDSNGPALYL